MDRFMCQAGDFTAGNGIITIGQEQRLYTHV